MYIFEFEKDTAQVSRLALRLFSCFVFFIIYLAALLPGFCKVELWNSSTMVSVKLGLRKNPGQGS